MKITLSFIALFLFFISTSAQSQKFSKDEHDKAIQFAESETNADYPVIFKVITNFIENGKTVSMETEVVENESEGRHRSKRTVLENGKETTKYQIMTGFGNVYCSDDGIKWNRASEYDCRNMVRLYSPREAEIAEYSVTTKSVKGKKIKMYREYLVFAPFTDGKKKTFRENISTIDSRGFFVTVEGTEGTLDLKAVTRTRKQAWVTKAMIKPVVAPFK
jgi:hypothetical protein